MKFHIITLGCKVNSYESSFIKESLEESGFSFCEDILNSDIIIINTCSVTDTSDKKSLKTLRRVKRENPKAILVVMGCSSQNNPDDYASLGVNILLGTKEKSKVPDLIKKYLETKENYTYITQNRETKFEDMFIKSFDHVRAYIKIQDGCDNFCSYCIIPYVRGSIRFKNYDEILKEASSLVAKGFKEIVLTGIHTGSYHFENKTLVNLIKDLSKISGLERLRLSSVEVTELSDDFMEEVLKNDKVFCPHLHIPLQSGCDKILKIMNRKYDLNYFEKKINKIRSIIPDIAITTDVIVGVNHETEEDFMQTYEFCKKMNFAKIHVFPYSKRNGTALSKMDGELDNSIKKKRARKLINLSDFLEKDYYNKFIGQKLEVLIESVNAGTSVGHTSNYLKVEIPKTLEVGKIYQEEIK